MRNIIYYISFLVLLFSCQNEVDKFDPFEYIAPGDFNDALILVQNLNQEKTFLNEVGTTIELEKSVIQIAPNAFTSLTGEQVSGEVVVEYIEISRSRDMIKYDLQTTDDRNSLLKSEFMLSVQARKDNKSLKLRDSDDLIKITVLDNNPESCVLYRNQQMNNENVWIATENEVESGSVTIEFQGTLIDSTGYTFNATSLGWMGLHKELSVTNFTELCLKLSDSNTPNNTRAYILYDNINTAQRLTVSSSSNCAITLVPQEFEGKLVVFAHKGPLKGEDQIEAESQRVIINSNLSDFILDLPHVDENEFIEFIESL